MRTAAARRWHMPRPSEQAFGDDVPRTLVVLQKVQHVAIESIGFLYHDPMTASVEEDHSAVGNPCGELHGPAGRTKEVICSPQTKGWTLNFSKSILEIINPHRLKYVLGL